MSAVDLRTVALDAIARFCELQGFPVPELVETQEGPVVRLVGRAPDGREFAIGYELSPQEYACEGWCGVTPCPRFESTACRHARGEYKAGEVRSDGNIQLNDTALGGAHLTTGRVWRTGEQAEIAQRHGWEPTGARGCGGEVQVRRG